jgi:hypothetical protein
VGANVNSELYRYSFSQEVPIDDVEAAIVRALLATESLHGESQTRLDASHHLDADRRACVIDAGTPVGRDFNRLFVGYMRREFGDDSFRVERVTEPRQRQENAT